jgi:tetratricopeptide (TPR) repeat protein
MKIILALFLAGLSLNLTAQHDETNEAKKYFNSGAEFYQKGQFTEAIKEFSKGLQYRSKITDSYLLCNLYMTRALCRMYLGSRDAFVDANEAVHIKPEYSKTYYIRSLIRLRILRDADNAIADIDTALQAKPGETSFLIQKMTCFEDKKMFKEELAIGNKILEDDSKNMFMVKMRGSVYLKLKDYDSAIKDFKRAMEALPNDFGAICSLANAYAQQNKWDEAKKYYFNAIQADSTQAAMVYNNLAYFAGQINNDFKTSVDYCNKALEKNPQNAFSYSNRGFAELKLGDMHAAMRDVQKSIDMDPKNSYAYKNRALILIAENKISSACLDLNKARQMDYAILYDDEVDKLLLQYCH